MDMTRPDSPASGDASALRLKRVDKPVSPSDLLSIANAAAATFAHVRDSMLEPFPRKQAPEFSTTALSALCGIDKSRVNYLVQKGELPPGRLQGVGKARIFTLAETQQWIRAVAEFYQPRPEGKRGRIVCCANFKGGVGKSSTAMALAQGLTLRGRRVLMVDLDPQASLSTLCGLLPDAEVSEEQTILPYLYGDSPDLRYAVMPTYWNNLDLIPGTSGLFNAEFVIPSRIGSDPKFRFWELLTPGLRELAADYDAIVIDTPPALSYLSLNSLFAADGLIMPLPPSSLDFASGTQFWRLFSDLTSSIESRSAAKHFDFVNVVLTKVDSTKASTETVREWIKAAYKEKVLGVEIPASAVVEAMTTAFGTIYDVTRWEGGSKTYARIRGPFDLLVELIDQKFVSNWMTPVPEVQPQQQLSLN